MDAAMRWLIDGVCAEAEVSDEACEANGADLFSVGKTGLSVSDGAADGDDAVVWGRGDDIGEVDKLGVGCCVRRASRLEVADAIDFSFPVLESA
jgi:hypothetical protein